MANSIAQILKLCQIFTLWLMLCVGVSCSTANIVLQALQLILSAVYELFTITIKAFGQKLEVPLLKTHHDIQTICHIFGVNTEIVHTVCCPECFILYSLESVPEICTWHQT